MRSQMEYIITKDEVHGYATAVAVHKGYQYTLALTRVERGEAMKDIVQRLLKIVRDRGVKVRFLLLDKGFYSVAVISYLKRARYGFIIPVALRGRKPKDLQLVTGVRALFFRFAKNKYRPEPQLFLELLRFKEMLLWITQVVQQALGADKTKGLDLETYQRLTATCRP